MKAQNAWLASLVEKRRGPIIQHWMNYVRGLKSPGYSAWPDQKLRDALGAVVQATLRVLETGDLRQVEDFVRETVASRLRQGFALVEVEQAFLGLEEVIVGEIEQSKEGPAKRLSAVRTTSYLHNRMALEIADLYESFRARQQARFEATYDLSAALSQTLDLDTILNTSVEKVASAMQARWAAIVLADEPGGPAALRASYGLASELAAAIPQVVRVLESKPESPTRPVGRVGRWTVPDARVSEPLKPWRNLLAAHECISLAGTPLIAAGQQLGTMIVCMSAEHEYTDDELDFLLALAGRTTAAVQNARLFEEAKGKGELSLLVEVGKLFTSTLDLGEVLRQVARLTAESVRADDSGVLLPDEAQERLHMTSHYARAGRAQDAIRRVVSVIEPAGIKVGAGGAGRAFATGEPLLIENYAEFPERIEELVGVTGSLLVVPMKLRDRVIGVFVMGSLRTGAFTEEDLSLAMGVADQAAIAIENARLYEDARKAAGEAQTLYSIATVLSSTLELDEILKILLGRMTEIAGVNRCCLLLLDPDAGTMNLAAAEGVSEEERDHLGRRAVSLEVLSAAGRAALQEGQALLVPDPRYETSAAHELHDICNVKRGLVVPFVTRGRLVGVAFLDERGKEHEFAPTAVKLLSSMAGTAAASIENATLLAREKNIAETFQKSFLPSRIPFVRGYELAARYKAALEEAEVGGDFYDVFEVSGNRVALLVADVSGKGISAAVHTAMGKYMIRAYAAEDPSPASVLERFNNTFSRFVPSGMFITIFYGILDVEQHKLTYANAGHDQPFLYSKAKDYMTMLDVSGPGAGTIPGAKYGQREIQVEQEDVLLVYTDGATDVRRDDKLLGLAGLRAIFMARVGRPAEETVETVFRAIMEHCGGRVADDIALLVLRKQP